MAILHSPDVACGEMKTPSWPASTAPAHPASSVTTANSSPPLPPRHSFALLSSPLPAKQSTHSQTAAAAASPPAAAATASSLHASHKPRAAGRQDSPPHAVLGAPPRRPERGPTPARDRDEGRSPGHARPEGAQEGEGAAEVGGAVAPLVEAVELPHLVPRRSAKLLSAFCSVLNRIQSGPTPAPCPPAEDAPPPPAPFPATQPVRFCTCVR